MIRKILKSILLKIVHYTYSFLIKLGICKPSIIVRMDGGICSQMHQYLLAKIFLNKGYKVEFDLSFFENDAKDINGNHARLFDLENAFPYIKIKRATEKKIKLYNLLYSHIGNYPKDCSTNWCLISPPKILLGYYADPDYVYSELYKNTFKVSSLVLDNENQKLFNQIERQNSIAVHVRRGDLSTYVEAYGYPVSTKYFQEAINYFIERIENPYFYFFSDDKDYVSKEILTNIPANINSCVVNNEPEKGYMDLFLISRCKHQITSKGSLGKYGALLGKNEDKIIIVSKEDKQTFMLNNCPYTIISI